MINEIIRKYRKENNMTQEEMASRLGVTAPAVNKWESGASTPDISLLAPIARLLHITLDELLSFNENLTEKEVNNIVTEMYGILGSEAVDEYYQKMVDKVREYPNAENLIIQLTSLLTMRCLVLDAKERAKYDDWIQNNYENLVLSADETIRNSAIESLYGFYISRGRYEDAEKCLDNISPNNPDKKRKQATIYAGIGKYDEAYKMLEEVLLEKYQMMSVLLHEIQNVALKTKNYKKAEAIIEKASGLAELFDMGEYNKNVNSIELAVALKDAGKTLEIMDLLMSNIDTLTDYTKSDLFEHMTFNNQMQSAASMVISTMLKQWDEDDAYQFVRESAGWEEFKKKWIN